jgi:hypothetical protein
MFMNLIRDIHANIGNSTVFIGVPPILDHDAQPHFRLTRIVLRIGPQNKLLCNSSRVINFTVLQVLTITRTNKPTQSFIFLVCVIVQLESYRKSSTHPLPMYCLSHLYAQNLSQDVLALTRLPCLGSEAGFALLGRRQRR